MSMLYVVRDDSGTIVLVSRIPLSNAEAIPLGSKILAEFVGLPADMDRFYNLDYEFIRVVEDLIDVLINKNLLRMTDLPAPAQRKLSQRKAVRDDRGGLSGLLGGDDVF